MEEKILAALAQLNGKFDTMQSDMAEMKADIAGLKTDVAGLKTDVAGLKKEQEGMAAQLHENHMLLTAVREAQDVQGAELDRLNMTTASRQSVERLKTTLATQLSAMSEAVVNA